MSEWIDADDWNEELTEEEAEELADAAEAIINAEHDSVCARNQWENAQETQEGDGFLFLS